MEKTYHLHSRQRRVQDTSVLQALGSRQSLTPSADRALLLGSRCSIVLSVSQDLHGIAQLGLAEQQERLAARVVRTAVVGGLGRHVGEVDAFVEHVAIDRRLGWSNAEALAKDAAVVCRTGAVPGDEKVSENDYPGLANSGRRLTRAICGRCQLWRKGCFGIAPLRRHAECGIHP
jgi:hypothetical protein